MNILNKINLYEVTEIKAEDKLLNLRALLGEGKELKLVEQKITKSAARNLKEIAVGDLVLRSTGSLNELYELPKLVYYPVKKIKGRFSDVKEYSYLKMKIIYDFNLYYLNNKIIEKQAKKPAHLEFEKLLTKNKNKITKLITYNQDEQVKPFNHTNYEVATIINSPQIYRQEIGNRFDWGWSLMEIYQLAEEEYVSFKQSSYFRERQRGEFFRINKKAVEFMRTFPEDKDYFLL